MPNCAAETAPSVLPVGALDLRLENIILSRESPPRRPSAPGMLAASDCTGFCTDCLRLVITLGYWPFRGKSLELIEVKGRRFIIRSLQRIKKAIGSDGVSANSTTSAFMINHYEGVNPDKNLAIVELNYRATLS